MTILIKYPRQIVAFGSLMGLLLSVVGCGAFSTKSEYEKFQEKETNFVKEIATAGGSAKKENKSMFGLNKMGWVIDLSRAKTTDRLIAQIVEASKSDPVFQLNLSDSAITDDQLARLDSGKALERTVDLDLSNTEITDAGLDKLSNLCWISSLNIKGSKATKEGAKKLGAKKIANPDTPTLFKKQPQVKS